jgi:hypothetical protein
MTGATLTSNCAALQLDSAHCLSPAFSGRNGMALLMYLSI